MKMYLRSLMVLFALVLFSGIEAEQVHYEHIYDVEHPVITAGEHAQEYSLPGIDLSSFHHVEKTQLSKLRVNVVPALQKAGIDHLVIPAQVGYDLPKSYHHPIPIGMKLIFPEHYFW